MVVIREEVVMEETGVEVEARVCVAMVVLDLEARRVENENVRPRGGRRREGGGFGAFTSWVARGLGHCAQWMKVVRYLHVFTGRPFTSKNGDIV